MNPVYQLRPVIKRVLIPKIIIVTSLCIIFYFSIWLNLSLLKIEMTSFYHTIALSLVLVLIIIESFMTYELASRERYDFYPDHIEHIAKKNTSFPFNMSTETTLKRGILDKMLGSSDIRLSTDFTIKNIPGDNQTIFYIQKLIAYSRGKQI